jgi:hypothetical protein
MSGIIPDGGVIAGSTLNTLPSPLIKAGCAALWFKMSCNPRFDSVWANAVISEFLNFTQRLGHTYDCASLDNLADAMDKFLCSIPTRTAVQVGTGSDYVAGCFNGTNGKILLSELSLLINPNLCGLPAVAAPDTNDTLAGCFDGVAGQASVASIAALVPVFNPCGLPAVAVPDSDDTLTGCFDGVVGQATISSILATVPAFNICALTVMPSPDGDDTLAGCFDGFVGQATISSILAAVPAFNPCGLTVFPTPDADDTLTGCFDGLVGQATIASILAAATTSVGSVLAVGAAYTGDTFTPATPNPGLYMYGSYVLNDASSALNFSINGVNVANVLGSSSSVLPFSATFYVEVIASGNKAYYRKKIETAHIPFISSSSGGSSSVHHYSTGDASSWYYLAAAPANLITITVSQGTVQKFLLEHVNLYA